MQKRKVAIFTGNRAEYGLQYPIIKFLANDHRFECYLIVSGAHLDKNFGKTIDEIRKDGLSIYTTVDTRVEGDSLYATTQAIGSGILNLSNILKDLNPDLFIVYADRFEGFSALITSTQMGIPTAHIEGGDITEGGALDDMVRHAMSRLAHLHFTTNEEASQRLKKMGEEPWRVFTVGFPGIDLIKEDSYASPQEIKKKYGIDMKRPIVICTQHPIATEYRNAAGQVNAVAKALIRLAKEDVQIIVTFPNNDAGSLSVINELKSTNINEQENIQIHKSLGRYYYYGFLNVCGNMGLGACVGNSSSGIKETPAFGCPAVNVGDRQRGRLRAENVIDTDYDGEQIYTAVKKCLFKKNFRKKCKNCQNPYGNGGTAKKIADVLAKVNIDLKLLQKKITY